MYDMIGNLALGLSEALTAANLLYSLIGVLLGTLIGVLPGLGPVATIATLLPITFTLSPLGAIIMLSGIYYGAQYGGSTTAILVNLPGESSSVVTCLDGYQMARRGRAGPALAIAAIGSFVAGTVATLVVAGMSAPLTELALKFGPYEYFSLMVFGLVGAVTLASGSLLKAGAMVFVGMMLGFVGVDGTTGQSRLTFGFAELMDGIEFVPLAMGLFGLAEVIRNLEKSDTREMLLTKVTGLIPTRADLRQSFPAILRGTALGSFLGLLPGGGAILSSFAAYALEKKIASDPSQFGKGDIRGVAAPESANNAGAQTSFIPMLTLGLPSNAVMALMIGALMIQGITPGPQIIKEQPSLFWGIIASMWIANCMLLVINLPLVGIWVKLLAVPYRFLFPIILLFSAIGVYSFNSSGFDIWVTAVFGVLGYFFLRVGAESAPLLLGFILGPIMEENLRRAMLLSRNSLLPFVERPISAAFLVASLVLLIVVLLPSLRKKREEVFDEPV